MFFSPPDADAALATLVTNPDFCNAGTVLNRLIYQANRELVIIRVNDKWIYDNFQISFELRMHTIFDVNELSLVLLSTSS